jgi:hypothetical protein
MSSSRARWAQNGISTQKSLKFNRLRINGHGKRKSVSGFSAGIPAHWSLLLP